jgi:hypothetical protein
MGRKGEKCREGRVMGGRVTGGKGDGRKGDGRIELRVRGEEREGEGRCSIKRHIKMIRKLKHVVEVEIA